MIQHGNGVAAIPPGETIKELLEDRDMSIKNFSERMGMPQSEIKKLINGEIFLTFGIADKLHEVLGPRSYFWVGLEDAYREATNIINAKRGAYKNVLEKI